MTELRPELLEALRHWFVKYGNAPPTVVVVVAADADDTEFLDAPRLIAVTTIESVRNGRLRLTVTDESIDRRGTVDRYCFEARREDGGWTLTVEMLDSLEVFQ